MLDVASGLAERDLTVDLVTIRGDGPLSDQVPPHVRLVDLRAKRALVSLPPLLRYLRHSRPDVLISTGTTANVVALIARLCSSRRMQLIVRESNTLSSAIDASRGWERAVLKAYTWLLPAAGVVVANSSGSATDLQGTVPRLRSPVAVIHNPVVWDDHLDRAALPVDHPWLNNHEVPVVLAAGRLVPQKDFGTLLRAVSQLAEERDVRLIVIGEGPERAALNRLAKKLGIESIVDFPGFQLQPLSFMARARVFALSSRYEGSPNVLIQAMGTGTPLVSTDCPNGPREILEDGQWGKLVPVGDWTALARAIGETLDRPASSEELIQRASDFSAESSIDLYLDLVTEAVLKSAN